MKFYQVGDKSQAICSHCEGLVSTTFTRRDVPFSDGQGTAKDILVAVCDVCASVVGVPAQSTPAIKAAREAAEVSIEARLPSSYFDRLDQAMHVITSSAATKHRKMFLSLYIDYLARKERSGNKVIFTWCEFERFTNQQTVAGKKSKSSSCTSLLYQKDREGVKRLSLKLNAYIASELKTLRIQTNLSQTELLKNVICQMQDEVVFRPNKELIKELTTLARVAI